MREAGNVLYKIAKRLHLPLLTFDGTMKRIGKELGITILGE